MRISQSIAASCLLLLTLAGCGGGGGGGSGGGTDPGAGSGGNGSVGTPPPGGGTTPPGGGTTPPPEGGSGGSSGGGSSGGGSETPPDTTPEAFTFTSQSNVARNTVVTSEVITVSGINRAVQVTVTGADTCVASVSGGSYSATPGEIANDQQLTVRVVSANQFGTHRECTVVIGAGQATFQVTTGPGLALAPSTITLGADDGLGALEQPVTLTL